MCSSRTPTKQNALYTLAHTKTNSALHMQTSVQKNIDWLLEYRCKKNLIDYKLEILNKAGLNLSTRITFPPPPPHTHTRARAHDHHQHRPQGSSSLKKEQMAPF